MATTKKIKKPTNEKRKLPNVDPSVFDEATETVVAQPDEGQDALAEALVQYDNEHNLAKHWEERRKDTQRELLGAMKSARKSELRASTDRENLTGKHVVTERNRIDAEKLKKALGAKLWKKVTTPALDEDKLEAAIKLGEVDPNVVASCSSTTESEYVKVTRRRRK